MRFFFRLTLALAAVLMLSLSPDVGQAALQANKTELEGTWDGVTSIGGGRTRTFASGELWITFQGDSATVKNFLGPEGTKHRIRLNTKVTPKHFDLVRDGAGDPIPGIYVLKGDDLTLVIPVSNKPTRPQGFQESDQAFRVSILNLRRRK